MADICRPRAMAAPVEVIMLCTKVIRECYAHLLENGDTPVLPTPVFFYGPQLQQELAVEIDPG